MPHRGGGISSPCLPVGVAFLLAYALASGCVSVLHTAIAAAVQSWCVDFAQNVLGQPLPAHQTWMMAVEETVALEGVHDFLLSVHAAPARRAQHVTLPTPTAEAAEDDGGGRFTAMKLGRRTGSGADDRRSALLRPVAEAQVFYTPPDVMALVHRLCTRVQAPRCARRQL